MVEIEENEPLKKEKREERLSNLCKENDIVFLAIFGSFLRNELKRKSDIDILIKFKKDSKKTLFDLVRLRYKLQNMFKRKVDLVEFDGLSNKYVRQEVLRTMRVIYEKR